MSKKDNDDMQTVRMETIEGNNNLVLGIQYGTSSIIGTRDYQQDSLFAEKIGNKMVAVVCDGMGGLEGGERASKVAVDCFVKDFRERESKMNDYPGFLFETARHMDRMVSNLSDKNGNKLDCGTTAVAAVIIENKMYWMSVGDSRIFLIRDNDVIKVNRDHNVRLVIDERMSEGTITLSEYKEKEKQAEALVSYIGMGGVSMIDVSKTPIPLKEGDIVILSSDGLYKRIPDDDLAEIIKYDIPDVKRAARHLNEVVMKRTKRSQDNTSIILMQYNYFNEEDLK